MKFVILSLLLSISCASSPVRKKITLETIQTLTIGKITTEEIFSLVGQPSARRSDSSSLSFFYASPEGVPHLTLKFDSKTTVLMQIVWMPQGDGPENELDKVKEHFQGATFQEVADQVNHPHLLLPVGFNFVDKATGVTIRTDGSRRRVEAIALYKGSSRAPSNKK